MRGGHICVAGVDLGTQEHVRPIHGHLSRELLSANGGPFDLGAAVELGEIAPEPHPPHIEDCRFDPGTAERQGELDPDDYLELIELMAFESLGQAFGPELQRVTATKFATPEGQGIRSLACLQVEGPLSMSYSDDSLELNFRVDGEPSAAAVTDLRYFEEDGRTTRQELIAAFNRRLRAGTPAWLMFGLARALRGTRVEGSWHWLQVNGICLEDAPLRA